MTLIGVLMMMIGLVAIALGTQLYFQNEQCASIFIPVPIKDPRNPNDQNGRYFR